MTRKVIIKKMVRGIVGQYYIMIPYILFKIENYIKEIEEEYDDDAESIIISERYEYISSIIKGCYIKKNKKKNETVA